MWGTLEEETLQRLIKEYKTGGDKVITFNGINGKLSQLIESMQLVKEMCCGK